MKEEWRLCGDLHCSAAGRRRQVMFWVAAIFTTALVFLPSVHSFAYEEKPFASFVPSGDSNETEFGFSIAYYENEEVKEKVFLVGSPSNNKGKRGALFSCPIKALMGGRTPCSSIPVDQNYYNGTLEDGICDFNVDHQRLGSTVATSRDQIMVCAPNWNNTCRKLYGDQYSALVGTCYVSNLEVYGTYTNFTPVYYYNTQKFPRYYTGDGHCQAGFSAALSDQENEVVLGAPGCHSWLGDVFWGDLVNSSDYRRRNQTYEESQLNPNITSSKSVTMNDRYMGYAVARGVFAGERMIISSAPKDGVYNKTLAVATTYILRKPTGDSATPLDIWATLFAPYGWMFALCGYSVAVVDFNGDGLDDVAVGCPQYGNDIGGFLIFVQHTNGMEREKVGSTEIARVGKQNGERLGTSFADLGDIDGDGYREFAVGAPEGAGGSGRVYIYRGQAGGLSIEPSQILQGAPDFRTLGWALAAGSGYLVAPGVGEQGAAVYRARRVMLPTLSVRTASKLPVEGVTSVPVEVCLSYVLRGGYPDTKQRAFTGRLYLDVTQEKKNLRFDDATESDRAFNVSAAAGAEECVSFDVRLQEASEAIEEYVLLANASFSPEAADLVVVDPQYLPMQSYSILQEGLLCDGETCTSNVTVKLQRPEKYFVYTTKGKFDITALILVEGDPTYVSKLLVDTNETLSFSAIMEGPTGVSCTGGSNFTCKFPNNIEEKAELKLILLPSQKLVDDVQDRRPAEFVVAANFTTYNDLAEGSTSSTSLTVPLDLDLQFELSGSTSPATIERKETVAMNFTFHLKNTNDYAYDVTLIVTETNHRSSCVQDLSVLAGCPVGESSTQHQCQYDNFKPDTTNTLTLTATVVGKEECLFPLTATANFSSLPFNLSAPIVTAAPSFTLQDAGFVWYTTWWVWLLIVLFVVIINVVCVIYYKCYKKQSDAADGDHGAKASQEGASAQDLVTQGEDGRQDEEETQEGTKLLTKPEQGHP